MNRIDNLKTLDLVYCFQKKTFEAALRDWQQAQVAAYPQKVQLIQTTVAAMRDFMTSPHVVHHNMVVRELLERARQQTGNE